MKENNIEEARERLEKRIKDIWFSTTYSQEQEEKDLKILLSDYKGVLKEDEEKDKIIDLMSEQLTTPIHDKRWAKEYFERKAKEVE